MKEILIFFAIAIAFVASCLKFQQISKEEPVVVVTEKDYIAKNGDYKYQPLKQNTLNFIKNFKNGRTYRAKKIHPKVVIYTNIVDTTDPDRKNFQKTMSKYSKSNKWKKGYSFENFDTHMAEDLYMNNEDKAEYYSFTRDCNPFCIVDLNKKLIFQGRNISDKYVANILYAFFNN